MFEETPLLLDFTKPTHLSNPGWRSRPIKFSHLRGPELEERARKFGEGRLGDEQPRMSTEYMKTRKQKRNRPRKGKKKKKQQKSSDSGASLVLRRPSCIASRI